MIDTQLVLSSARKLTLGTLYHLVRDHLFVHQMPEVMKGCVLLAQDAGGQAESREESLGRTDGTVCDSLASTDGREKAVQ